MTRFRLPLVFAYLLFFASGGAGLAYQVCWTRLFTTGLGHEMPATLAVVGAFFCGMALGAGALDRPISASLRPGRWYAVLEIAIGAWGSLTALFIPAINAGVGPAMGVEPTALQQGAMAFGVPLVALLPATAALGATLPAMERFVSGLSSQPRCIGALYAVNTLGAVVGIIFTVDTLMPTLGFRGSVFALAVGNLGCGLVAWMLQEQTGPIQPRRDPSIAGVATGRLWVTLFFTGLLGIGYETLGVRVLAQALSGTIHTYAAVLAIYLLGTALGGVWSQWLSGRGDPAKTLTTLLGGLALTCALGIWIAGASGEIAAGCRRLIGGGSHAGFTTELLTGGAVFLLPTVFMGATFSYLAQAARQPAGGVGTALALNLAGGALAPALFGALLLPALGAKWALVTVVAGYLALLPTWRGWRWAWLAAPLILLAVFPAELRILDLPPGGRVIAWREGVLGTVAVVAEPDGHRVLRVDNRFQMGGSAAVDSEVRQLHVPVLLHPAPRRALVLGVGTGITLGAASLYPELQADGVELVPEVTAVMPHFEPENRAIGRSPNVRLFVADARRFVGATTNRYDVIVADLFHPYRDGAGMLYTREHFDAVRRRLMPAGLFCQWLPLHQLDELTLRTIVRTFLEVFPESQAWLLRFNVDAPVVGLIGTAPPRSSSPFAGPVITSEPALTAELKRLALADPLRLAGHWLAGPEALRRFAARAPANTDDKPRVLFATPRQAAAAQATPYGRLLSWLEVSPPDPRSCLDPNSTWAEATFLDRWSRYLEARNVYLRGLVAECERRPERALDAFVESARLSADFTAGYAQCLSQASLLAASQPAAARALLERLIEAQPGIPVAAQMLERLSSKAAPSANVPPDKAKPGSAR